MARKKKEEEITIVAGKRDSEQVTDLQVMAKDQKIGEVYQGEGDRQYQIIYENGRKGTAISIEDAVRSIIAEYNLHK